MVKHLTLKPAGPFHWDGQREHDAPALVPTAEQFKSYRAARRLAVRRIVDCAKAGVVPINDWSCGVIRRVRGEHSASVKRQHAL